MAQRRKKHYVVQSNHLKDEDAKQVIPMRDNLVTTLVTRKSEQIKSYFPMEGKCAIDE